MKKFLILLAFFMAIVLFAEAQKLFKINMSQSYVYNPATSVGGTATVHTGDIVYLSFNFKNDGSFDGKNVGTDSFPGGTFGFVGAVAKKPDFPTSSNVRFTENIKVGGSKYGGNSSTIMQITIDSRFPANEKSIIIIWPNDSKGVSNKDSMDSTYKYPAIFYFNVLAKESTSSIKNFTAPENFNIYPNPAKDLINFEMVKAAKGTLTLTDISGKVLLTKTFETVAGGKITLPLTESTPDGVYLVNIETSTFKEVRRIIISK